MIVGRIVSTRTAAALAAVAILSLVPSAQAQRYGGGRSFGGVSVGGISGGGYGFSPGYGGYRGPGYGGYGLSSGYGYGFSPGYGGYRSPGYYYAPGYYGNQASFYQPHVNAYGYQGNFRNYVPNYNYGYYQPYGTALNSNVQPPPDAAINVPGGTTQSAYAPAGNAARLTVRVPDDAQLWVDNFQPQLTGPVRVVNTPPLQPGQGYHYTVKAQWNENGRPVVQERIVNFQAGGDVTVDFTQPQQPSASPTVPSVPTTPSAPPSNPPAAPPIPTTPSTPPLNPGNPPA